jgi:putative endonuclease
VPFVYLLQCRDGTLYAGWTTDLSRRVAAHNQGTGARYTRGRRPVKLVYWEAADSREMALRREAELRRLDRPAKLALIANHTNRQPSQSNG